MDEIGKIKDFTFDNTNSISGTLFFIVWRCTLEDYKKISKLNLGLGSNHKWRHAKGEGGK